MGKFFRECADSLTLYVRTLGWLDAVLKPAKKPQQKKVDQDEAIRITRRKKLLDDGIDMPELDPGPAAYLLDFLYEIGPMHFTAMGEVPIGYEQIDAWQRVTGSQLSPWEAATLCELSCAYGNEKALGANPLAAAPGGMVETPEQVLERRERVSSGLAQMLRSFKRGPNA